MATATCTKCKVEKPATDFQPNPRKRNGLQSWCRKCQNAKTTENNRNAGRREYMRNYYLANRHRRPAPTAEAKQAAVARVAAWRKGNTERRRELDMRRRARMRNNGVFQILERELLRLYALPCAKCSTTKGVTLDHIIPLARGGRHSVGNLQPLCGSCNASKNDRLMIEWQVA